MPAQPRPGKSIKEPTFLASSRNISQITKDHFGLSVGLRLLIIVPALAGGQSTITEDFTEFVQRTY